MNYSEMFYCDLALAIHQNVIDDETKVYYSACAYSALNYLHENGLMHRFINPGSIYITADGIPKLADLRYCKRFNGQKAFTICGDPCYFAPEIVKQQGYNYSADLWALGCLIYEMHEGKNPMGTADREEVLFKTISNFDPDILEFSKKSHKKVRSVITALLTVDYESRCGYKGATEFQSKKMFSRTKWSTVGSDPIRFDLLGSTDDIFVEESLDKCIGNTFFEDF